MSKTFTASVVQFLRPNGRIRYEAVDLPIEAEELYKLMQKAGMRFEAEKLSTGQVSLTISDRENDRAIRLVPNGPQVLEALVELLEARPWEDEPEDDEFEEPDYHDHESWVEQMEHRLDMDEDAKP
ncbi:hypothetical protein [Thiocapsa sp. N5-Cardenillas]|uniref:hypothetical protein n=1 Tax=Thiocapsa sp. N5-Cardenillas TaxID=3137397 RepID=UPI0035AFD5B9